MQLSLPIKQEDGNVKFELTLSSEQVQAIVQFGLNIAMSMGITSQLIGEDMATLLEDENTELDD